MKKNFILPILAAFAIIFCSTQAQAGKPLGEKAAYARFQNPGNQYKPFVRWWWNGDAVEAQELIRELRLLKEAGIGGVELNALRGRPPWA